MSAEADRKRKSEDGQRMVPYKISKPRAHNATTRRLQRIQRMNHASTLHKDAWCGPLQFPSLSPLQGFVVPFLASFCFFFFYFVDFNSDAPLSSPAPVLQFICWWGYQSRAGFGPLTSSAKLPRKQTSSSASQDDGFCYPFSPCPFAGRNFLARCLRCSTTPSSFIA